MDEHRKSDWSFAALASGEAAARGLAFATTLVIAARVGPGGLGVVAVAIAVVLYLSRVVDAGFDLGLGIREAAAPRHDLADLVSTILIFRLAIAAVFVAVCVLVAGIWPGEQSRMIALYSATLLPLALSVRWALIGLHRSGVVAAVRAIGELLALLAVFGLVHQRDDLWRAPVGQLLGDSAAAGILLVVLWRSGHRFAPRWRGDVIRDLLPHVIPYAGTTLLGLALFNADLLFLRGFHGAATAGLYAAAYVLVSFVINLGDTYSIALIPTFSKRIHEPILAEVYAGAWIRCILVTLPVAVGGAIVAEHMIRLFFGAAFETASLPLGILIASAPFSVLRSVATAALIAAKEEAFLLRAVGFTAAVNVALNLIIVPRYGMVGAALVTLSTEALRLLVYQRRVRGLGLMAPALSRWWKPVLAVLIMAGVLQTGLGATLVKAIVAGAFTYGVAIFAVGGISRHPDGWRLTM